MTSNIYYHTTAICWTALTIYWIIMAFNTKESIYQQKFLNRLIQLLGIAVCFTLMYSGLPHSTWLDKPLFAQNHLAGILGLAICIGSIFFIVSARKILGTNWSGDVTLKKEHELIKTGPYSWVRHPIYTGLLFGLLGSALTTGLEIRAILGIVICFSTIIPKLKHEEKMLTMHFPEDYPEYKRKVKGLIPFIF